MEAPRDFPSWTECKWLHLTEGHWYQTLRDTVTAERQQFPIFFKLRQKKPTIRMQTSTARVAECHVISSKKLSISHSICLHVRFAFIGGSKAGVKEAPPPLV